MELDMNALSERIKKIRKDLRLSQEEFANRVNIHPKQLAKYETQKSCPSLAVLIKIALFCEVSTDYLLFGDNTYISNKIKINDRELLDCFKLVNSLKKADRDKIKWGLQSLIKGTDFN